MKQDLLSVYQPDGGAPPPEELAEILRDVAVVCQEGMPMTGGPYVEGKERMRPVEVWPFQGELDG